MLMMLQKVIQDISHRQIVNLFSGTFLYLYKCCLILKVLFVLRHSYCDVLLKVKHNHQYLLLIHLLFFMIIDSYIQLITTKYPDVYGASVHFMTKLQVDPSAARRWIKEDLMKFRVLLFPTHEQVSIFSLSYPLELMKRSKTGLLM